MNHLRGIILIQISAVWYLSECDSFWQMPQTHGVTLDDLIKAASCYPKTRQSTVSVYMCKPFCVWMSESVYRCSTSCLGPAGWSKTSGICLAAHTHTHTRRKRMCNVETFYFLEQKWTREIREGFKTIKLMLTTHLIRHFVTHRCRRAVGLCIS